MVQLSKVVIYWNIWLQTSCILRHETLAGLNRNQNPDFPLTLILQAAQKNPSCSSTRVRDCHAQRCALVCESNAILGWERREEEEVMVISTVQNQRCSWNEKSVLHKLKTTLEPAPDRGSYLLGSRALWANSSSVGPARFISPSWKDAWEAPCWEISKGILKLCTA